VLFPPFAAVRQMATCEASREEEEEEEEEEDEGDGGITRAQLTRQ